MESNDRNYISLRAEFYVKEQPSKGFDLMRKLVSANKDRELYSLLGHHRKRSYRGIELEQRFWTDELIGYYNLLLLAVFAGFLPRKLDKELAEEINEIMGNGVVMEYYTIHYPYKLAEYTCKFAADRMEYTGNTSEESLRIFNDYLVLNRFLKNDSDIDVFLGMLDYVSYGQYGIQDVIESLKSFEKLSEIITSEDKSILAQGVWGFIKYTSFISQLKELMKSAEDFPVLRSAIWMYHEYYFKRMQVKMESFFDEAFDNLKRTMSNEKLFKKIIDEAESLITDELEGENIEGKVSYGELMEFSIAEIDDAQKDIDFILKGDWDTAIAEYFRKSQRLSYEQ